MHYKNKAFASVELSGKDFNEDTFDGCKFMEEIKFTNFTDCTFKNCDLSQGLYNSVSFTKCFFPESKLSNINFGDIKIDSCDFTNSVMENCIFQRSKRFDLKTIIFNNTNLQRSVFQFCDLEKVKLDRCDLTLAVFERCNIKETNFEGSKLEGTSFEDCNIVKTILDVNGFISYGMSKGFIMFTND